MTVDGTLDQSLSAVARRDVLPAENMPEAAPEPFVSRRPPSPQKNVGWETLHTGEGTSELRKCGLQLLEKTLESV
jgi:hypothetical protein